MMIRRLIASLITIILACLSATHVFAIDIQAHSEHLIVKPPQDWHLAHLAVGQVGELAEYVPNGHQVEDWTDLFAYAAMPFSIAPDIETLIDDTIAAYNFCNKLETSKSPIKNIDGIRVGYLDLKCVIDKDLIRPGPIQIKPVEIYRFKFIKTKNRIYKLWRAWHGTKRDFTSLPKNYQQDWNSYFELAEVCDLSDPDLICRNLNIIPSVEIKENLEQIAEAVNNDAGMQVTSLERLQELYGTFVGEMEISVGSNPTSSESNLRILNSLKMDEVNWNSAEELNKVGNNVVHVYRNGHVMRITGINKNDPLTEMHKSREQFGNFMILLKKLLYNVAKIPYESMQINLTPYDRLKSD